MKIVCIAMAITVIFCSNLFAQVGVRGTPFSFGIASNIGPGIVFDEDVGLSWLSSIKFKSYERKLVIIRGGILFEEELGDISVVYRQSFCKGLTKKSSQFIFDDKKQEFLEGLYYSRFRPYIEAGIGTSFSGGGGVEYYFTKYISGELGADLYISFIDDVVMLIPKIELTFWPL